MPLPSKTEGMIRALIYPVQFDQKPTDGADRVLEMVVEANRLDRSPEEYLAAIHEALASDASLAELIPQDHSEQVIRDYLADMGRRIEERWHLH
jgi:hypothetical protein